MTEQPPAPEPVSLLRIAPSVYLPTFLFAIGQGAIQPIVALSGRDLGASVGMASLLLAFLGVGQILGDLPAGWLAARVGDRRAMQIAAALAMFALLGCALSQQIWLFGISVLANGMTNSVFMLARQSYLTEVVPPHQRARALSTLGGMNRIGVFLGPFLGAWVISGSHVQAAYYLAIGASVAVSLALIIFPDVPLQPGTARPAVPLSFREVLSGYWKVFTTLGIGVLLVSAVRGARQTVLPLWAEHIHLSPATASVIFGIAGGVDMLLFYPSGKLMDARGRLWVALPSMFLLGTAFLLLPLTNTLLTMTLVAMLMGFGNGMGSGIMMTLGSDVAPANARSQFLGIWRICADSGNAAGPLIVSGATALGSLAAGILAMGACGWGAVAALGRWVPRWSPYANLRKRDKGKAKGAADAPDGAANAPDRAANASDGANAAGGG